MRERGLAVALLAAATLTLTFPLWTNPGGLRMGAGADPDLYLWNIGWNLHALTHAPWALVDANIFHPHRYTLAYSEHLIGSSLLALPFAPLFDGPVGPTNLVSLLSVWLCGVGGWFLGRSLGLSPTASILCGLIFAFAPPRFARMPQLHLNPVQWMPFALGFLHRYFERGRPADLRWALLMASAQALTSGHGTVLMILAGIALTSARLVSGWPLAPARRLRDVGLVGLAALVPGVLSYVPYLLAGMDQPFNRVTDHVGVTLVSYLSSPTYVHRWLLAQLPQWPWVTAGADAFLFPGIVAVLLAGAALFTGRPRPWVWFAIVVLTWWMTVGPPLSLWQWVYHLPLIDFIRVPSRFTILGVLALGVLAGYGFDRITRDWPPRRRIIAGTCCALAIVAESRAPVDARPYTLEIPAIDRWLATQPGPMAIAEVPVSSSGEWARRAEVATMYMLHSTAHYRPTVFGYSGIEPADYRPLYESLIHFPDTATLDLLAARGVTHVVAHLEFHTEAGRQDFLARVTAAGDRLELVHEIDLGRVYRLKR